MRTLRYFLFLFSLVLLFGVVSAVPSPPVANFTANVTSGTAPLSVKFTDLSLNSPTGWAWFFGDESYRQSWTLWNPSSGWSERYYHSSVAMPDGSIVLMGGFDGDNKNDTWRSTNNGKTYTLRNESSGWSARKNPTSVAMPDSSIVLMGGTITSTIFKNDTWRSTDNGATWKQVNASAGWTPRWAQCSVVTPEGSIVLMGGSASDGIKNDTWCSTDNGSSWTRMSASAGWTARMEHSCVAMPDNSILLMGGVDLRSRQNDTWRSTDKGATWTRVNASSGWMQRNGHCSVAMPDDSVVLIGGYIDIDNNTNDVWRSMDNGRMWTQVNASAGWTPRYKHTCVSMRDGSIILMGGLDANGLTNVTWRFMPVVSSAQNPSHTYTTPGIYQVALQVYNAIGYNSTRKAGYITVTGSKTKIGVFRNSTHLFYLDFNGNGTWDGSQVDRQHNFGLSGDLPISGDWDNNGISEIGVFRNSTHLFLLDYNGNGVWNGASIDKQYNFGLSGDVPVTGDWNNDGKYEIGVFRNSTHLFLLDYNGNGVWNGASIDKQYNFGLSGDVPVTGDWNNDGRTEIGVFRNSTHIFYLDYNGNGAWNGGSTDRQYNFGITGDIPVSADWNDDGKSDIGVFRNSTHVFYLDYNGNGAWNGASVDRQYNFGITGDIPITGSWS